MPPCMNDVNVGCQLATGEGNTERISEFQKGLEGVSRDRELPEIGSANRENR